MDWKEFIREESKKEYFINIFNYLEKENEEYYPKKRNIFKAFELTPYDDVKVVLIGQDPYHEEGQAHGLAFSVENNIPPVSLQNLFKELYTDLGIKRTNPNLTDWAEQGILLLNATLTVHKHIANSHSKIGWNIFTDAVIRELNKKEDKVVFILLGNFAIQKEKLIDTSKHLIVKAAHPSFFSCKLFFGSKIFSKTNNLLESIGKEPIKW